MYSAGMVLHDWEREKVQEVFNCKLQDRYGCEELGLIAAECKEQQGLHINTDCLYVEFLDKHGDPVAPGEPGHIVITDLTNKVMPFIRYDLEDICVHSSKKCPCGRTQPLIEKIEGRVADFLVTPEGALVSGISLTDHFAGHIPGVAQMQIVQEEMDELVLVIVKDGNYGDKSREAIARLVREFFGEKMLYRCDFVKAIETGRSGKYRFAVCKVNHGLL
jgi:phenylacetate-CoA ligase